MTLMYLFSFYFVFLHAGFLLASATNLHLVNNVGCTICVKHWVPNSPIGGGCNEIAAGGSCDLGASSAWQSATLWAIPTSCAGQPCNTGPPTGVTQFEFTLGGFSNHDYYDVSMRAGFNRGISVYPTNPSCHSQKCTAPQYCEGMKPDGVDHTLACPYGSTDYVININ